MSRRLHICRTIRRFLCTPPPPHPHKQQQQQPPPKRIFDRAAVEAAAAERRRQASVLDSARRVSSWMMPWERAQMDAPTRPLKVWERVYWRLLVVLGGVGFAYETWVMGNRRLWKAERGAGAGDREASGLYGGNQAFGSQRLLTDEEVENGVGLKEFGRG